MMVMSVVKSLNDAFDIGNKKRGRLFQVGPFCIKWKIMSPISS